MNTVHNPDTAGLRFHKSLSCAQSPQSRPVHPHKRAQHWHPGGASVQATACRSPACHLPHAHPLSAPHQFSARRVDILIINLRMITVDKLTAAADFKLNAGKRNQQNHLPRVLRQLFPSRYDFQLGALAGIRRKQNEFRSAKARVLPSYTPPPGSIREISGAASSGATGMPPAGMLAGWIYAPKS